MVSHHINVRTAKFVLFVMLSYLVVTPILHAYLIQSKYQHTVDEFLISSAEDIWQDGAEFGVHSETQKILTLKSNALIDKIAMQNPVQIFSSCHSIQTPKDISSIGNIALRSPLLFWVSLYSANQEVFVAVKCELKTDRWLLLTLCLSLLSIMLYWIRPRTLSPKDSLLLGMLSKQLSDITSITLFKKSIRKFRMLNPDAVIDTHYLQLYLSNKATAKLSCQDLLIQLQLASQPDSICFSLENEKLKISVNNIEIPVSITPAIYWLWYAQKKVNQQKDGWIVNPPANRPCLQQASELIELMEKFGGHGRAISELRLHGLRAKTLDQNRNKIKEALQTVLGERGGDNLGFESVRNNDSQQYLYRLKISPNQINIHL